MPGPRKMNRAELEARRRKPDQEQQEEAFAERALPEFARAKTAPELGRQLYPMQMRFTATMIEDIDALRALEYPHPATRPSRHAWILDAVLTKLDRKRDELSPKR